MFYFIQYEETIRKSLKVINSHQAKIGNDVCIINYKLKAFVTGVQNIKNVLKNEALGEFFTPTFRCFVRR